MRAKKTGLVIRGRYSDHVEYEYRGHKYEVEYAKDWSYCCPSPATQHRNEQARIDSEIEAKKRKPAGPVRYEDTAQYGFDLFWDYVTEGEQNT